MNREQAHAAAHQFLRRLQELEVVAQSRGPLPTPWISHAR
jgi:hypothetical protein